MCQNAWFARWIGTMSVGLVGMAAGCGVIETGPNYPGALSDCNGLSWSDLQDSYDSVAGLRDAGGSQDLAETVVDDCYDTGCRCFRAIIDDVYAGNDVAPSRYDDSGYSDDSDSDWFGLGESSSGGTSVPQNYGPQPLAGWSQAALNNMLWTYTPPIGP